MSKLSDVEIAIKRSLTFLVRNQEADGSFISFSSASMRPFRRIRSWQTTFVPALMLTALADLNTPEARIIKEKLAAFLMTQKNDDWSFNYWSKDAPEYTSQPYPNDLDDTFCALAGLYRYNPSLVNATMLAKIVKLLLATETAVGGPYRTWLVPANSQPVWLDVDIAVNSNIDYFLSLVGNHLPNLEALMDRAIVDDSFSSPYYPSPYAFIYYLARAYKGSHQNRLLSKARRLHKTAKTDLDRALCLGARLRLDETRNLSSRVSELLTNQRRDGSWQAAAFYADPVKNGKLYYNGAPAMTTVFVVEALQLYLQDGQARHVAEVSKSTSSQDLNKTVLTMAKKQCQDLGQDLRSATLGALQQVANGRNGREVIGLAYGFNGSLAKPLKAPANFIEALGVANLYGWLAYTIYDDFLDGEGQPELISVANAAMRRSLDNFSEALPSNSDFNHLVRQTFDTIDSANAWELAHCRFERRGNQLVVGKLPDYGDLSKLAERSLGHALPPMAILAATGIDADKPSGKHLLQALRHYLIARQLNDDAHDWPDDLRNGHITPVAAMLLAQLKVKPGSHPLPELLTDARRQFWHSTLPEICRLMRRQVRLSRQALRHSGLLRPDNVISGLLDGLEASIADTLQQQSQAEAFLKHYKRKKAVGA